MTTRQKIEEAIKMHNYRIKIKKKLLGKVTWADQVYDKPLPKYKKRVTWADERNVGILPRYKKPSILWRQPAY